MNQNNTNQLFCPKCGTKHVNVQHFCLHCGYKENQIVIYGVPKNDISKNDNNTKQTILTKREDTMAKNSTRSSFNINRAESFLASIGLKGATIDEIIAAVQPEAFIYQAVSELCSDMNIILMPGNRYVHVSAFVDLDEAADFMSKILHTHFRQFGGYSNNKLLFGAAENDLSMFLNDNDCADIDSVYSLAYYFFGKEPSPKYHFEYPHIFEKKPDYPPNLKGLMINLARMNEGILNAESAKEYLKKAMLTYGGINQLLQISSSDIFLMYAPDKYLLSESLNINKEWLQELHDCLDKLFCQEDVAYIIPRDISSNWLSSLPNLTVNLPWTLLLLQEVIKKYPEIGFKLITAQLSQTFNTIAAAFVPADSPIQSFADLVTLFMQERHKLPKRMSCEELRLELRDAGMLQGGELISALPRALKDYRFSFTDNNKTVYVRGN